MTEKELHERLSKAITGLGICSNTNQTTCNGCPYEGLPFCIQKLMRETLILLEVRWA